MQLTLDSTYPLNGERDASNILRWHNTCKGEGYSRKMSKIIVKLFKIETHKSLNTHLPRLPIFMSYAYDQ